MILRGDNMSNKKPVKKPVKKPTKKTKKPAGRPTTFTKLLANKICARIACGESMRSVARDTKMPAMSTLFKWLSINKEFKDQYVLAKTESADVFADDILDIVDNAAQPVMVDGKPVVINGKVIMVTDAVSVAHARLRMDARKWAASKLKPKKYGDRIISDVNVAVSLTDLSDDELERKLKILESKQINE